MKKFSKIFLKCIRETPINHVRMGKDRMKFTGIWMVEIDGRIFARSYYRVAVQPYTLSQTLPLKYKICKSGKIACH